MATFRVHMHGWASRVSDPVEAETPEAAIEAVDVSFSSLCWQCSAALSIGDVSHCDVTDCDDVTVYSDEDYANNLRQCTDAQLAAEVARREKLRGRPGHETSTRRWAGR